MNLVSLFVLLVFLLFMVAVIYWCLKPNNKFHVKLSWAQGSGPADTSPLPMMEGEPQATGEGLFV